MTAIPAGLFGALGLVNPAVLPLSGGALNRALRVRDAGHDLVIRLPHAGAVQLGVDHRAESSIQRVAAAAGLAPELVLAQPETGLLVTRFVSGRALTREDLHDPALLRRLGGWFARLHALPLPAGLAAVDIGSRAAGFLSGLRVGGDADGQLAERVAVLRAGLRPPVRLVPCHHDLHHRNLIDAGGELVAVDWEYSGPGDAAADVAACVGYHDLDAEHVMALLAGYGEGATAIAARLPALRQIFDCLCQGWAAQVARLPQPVAVD